MFGCVGSSIPEKYPSGQVRYITESSQNRPRNRDGSSLGGLGAKSGNCKRYWAGKSKTIVKTKYLDRSLMGHDKFGRSYVYNHFTDTSKHGERRGRKAMDLKPRSPGPRQPGRRRRSDNEAETATERQRNEGMNIGEFPSNPFLTRC